MDAPDLHAFAHPFRELPRPDLEPVAARQILFRDPMVVAIRASRKCVTRRVGPTWSRVQVGDRLWVREAWRTEELESGLDGIRYRADDEFRAVADHPDPAERWVMADHHQVGDRWRSPLHLPRWACRLELVVTSIRVETPPLALLVDDLEAACEGFDSAEAFLAAWVAMHPNHVGSVYRVSFSRVDR